MSATATSRPLPRAGAARLLTRAVDLAEAPPLRATRSERVLASAYLVAAVLIAIRLPSAHGIELVPLVCVVAAYWLGPATMLPLGSGYATIVQPAFVVALFAMPLNLVPLFVAVCTASSYMLGRRAVRIEQAVLGLVDSWYCLAPVLIIAAFAPGPAAWSHWPVYAAAFIAEFAVNGAVTAVRLGLPEHGPVDTATLLLPACIDALLTPVGLAAAVAMASAPGAAVAVLAGVEGMMVLLGRERNGRLQQEHRALRDPLTGLPNRALFDELLTTTWRRCRRAKTSGALLLIDLDGFKAINDAHGHLVGDRALQGFADRLRSAVHAADTPVRLGGDEFAILLAGPGTADAARCAASAVHAALKPPLEIEDVGELRVRASIGAATFGPHRTPGDALGDADRALYAAKRRTR